MPLHSAFCPLHETNIVLHCVSEENDNCSTPDSKRGQCIDLKKCPVLISMLTMTRPLPPEVIDFLRKSQCGFRGNSPMVCCPVPTFPALGPLPAAEGPVDVSNHSNLALLPRNICGPVFGDKIYNGKKTSPFQYPWMALIGYNRGN